MTLFGIDVSEYQTGLDLGTVKGAGFVAARATRGPGLHKDPAYAGFKARAKALDLPFTAYHFMGEDPVREAALTQSADASILTPWMLDLEPSTKYGTRPTYDQALRLRALIQADGRRVPLLYFPHWYWEQIGRPTLSADSWGGLVQSSYPLGYDRGTLEGLYDRIGTSDFTAAWSPMGGVTPLLWQYTSSVQVPGFTANTVDGNAFRGTQAELRAANVLRFWSASDTVDPVATSENGWPVLFDNRTTGPLPRLREWIVPDADRHLLLRDGSAGFLLIDFASWWNDRFNPLSGGTWDEWGWAVRPVRGQTTGYSNHASGTAEDLDATEFPRGIPILSRIKAANVARIHRRLSQYVTTTGLHVLRWGGDYTKTVDGMHTEIAPGVTLADVEEVARARCDTPRGRRILAANPGARDVIFS